MTKIVHWQSVPSDAVWCIGQHSKEERAQLERKAKYGLMEKVRAHWAGISSLKTVFIPIRAGARREQTNA